MQLGWHLLLLSVGACTLAPEFDDRVMLQEAETARKFSVVSRFECSRGTVEFVQTANKGADTNTMDVSYAGRILPGSQQIADRIVQASGDKLTAAQISLLRCPMAGNGDLLSAVANHSSGQSVFFRVVNGTIVVD